MSNSFVSSDYIKYYPKLAGLPIDQIVQLCDRSLEMKVME